MRPIEIEMRGQTSQSPQEICTALLDTSRWSEFTGYFVLPGITSADFERRTPEVLGSRIRVQNTAGSSHIEEIVAWDTSRQVVLKFQEFSPPLQHLATHFLETWRFAPSPSGRNISRSLVMDPKSWLGRLRLLPISRLLQKAFEKNLVDLAGEVGSFDAHD